MRSALVVALALVPSVAQAGRKHQPAEAAAGTGPTSKTPSVCGAKILPLAVGNEWTYEAVTAPSPAADEIKRLIPREPKTVVVTVKSIDAKKGADTVVTLEETSTFELSQDPKKQVLDQHTVTTTITCDGKAKFEISPDSFWFAGEPGGSYGLKLDTLEHLKGTSWQLTKGSIGDAEWREDLKVHWTRVASEGSQAKFGGGTLELERRFTPQQPEMIVTKLGSYSAEKLGLITTGRVVVDTTATDAKPMELPAAWVSQLWIAEGAGVVQALNSYAHMYQLTDAKLK